jgi:EpsI family protein
MLAVALAAVSLWNPLLAYLDRQGEHGPVQFAQVASGGEFTPADVALLPVWSPSYSGMRSEYRAAWSGADRPVGLYIAYYRDQKAGEELINSENRVLISKDPVWKRTASGSPQVKLGTDEQTWASLEMVSAHGRMIVWNAYWVGGRWTTNDYLAKVYLALATLRGEGDDSAAVMVYAPYVEGEHDAAAATLERFLADMGGSLAAMLAQTSAR